MSILLIFSLLFLPIFSKIFPRQSNSSSLLDKFDNDAITSVSQNFVGCKNPIKLNWEDFLADPSNSTLLYINLPIEKEIQTYLSLPSTRTKTIPELAVGKVKGHPKGQEWANQTQLAWQIPPYHPRNSMKNLCLNMTWEASDPNLKIGKEFYPSDFRSSSLSSQYILRFSNAFIHDNGIVGLSCGYFQSHESCETLYKFLGRNWHRKCVSRLTSEKKTWDSMFSYSSSELERYNTIHRSIILNESLSSSSPSISSSISSSSSTQTLPFPLCSIEDDDMKRPTEQQLQMKLKKQLKRKMHFMKTHTIEQQREEELIEEEKRKNYVPFPSPSNISMVDELIVISSGWDNNYHHFLLDSLLRVIRYWPFLQSHPHIKIHIRQAEKFSRERKYVLGGVLLRERIWKLLGFETNRRLISGPVLARRVYYPRASLCNSPLSHALEIRSLTQLLKNKSREWLSNQINNNINHNNNNNSHNNNSSNSSSNNSGSNIDSVPHLPLTLPIRFQSLTETDLLSLLPPPDHPLNIESHYQHQHPPSTHPPSTHQSISLSTTTTRRQIILQHRHCPNKRACSSTWREWDDAQFSVLYQAIHSRFSETHDILIQNASDHNSLTSTTNCLACQIYDYSKTDILIGIHGAGLTNLMFLPPRALLVEMIGQFDGRMLPLCGYHGPLAAVFGVNHYLFYYDWKAGEQVDTIRLVNEVENYYYELKKI